MIEELDDSTGRILETIRAFGLAERTLVIFTSDNGPERRTPGSAAPLRGTKHTVYEGGLRVPCIAWWPGRVPPGRVCDDFLTTLELLPTFAALAGADPPPGGLDGHDISAVLLGMEGAVPPRSALYSLYGIRDRRLQSMREGRWKLVLAEGAELYDLATDLSETTNLAERHPEIVQKLNGLAEATRRETKTTP